MARRALLYGVLATAVLIAIYADHRGGILAMEQSKAIALPSNRSFSANDPKANVSVSPTPILKDREHGQVETNQNNPFAAKAWGTETAGVPIATEVKAPPAAPPLPFAYAGKFEEPDGSWVVYLVKGDTSYEAHQGETFDNNYRLNAIQATQLEIEYLPLATKQTLSTVIESQ